jgi:hypothetical protein
MERHIGRGRVMHGEKRNVYIPFVNSEIDVLENPGIDGITKRILNRKNGRA